MKSSISIRFVLQEEYETNSSNWPTEILLRELLFVGFDDDIMFINSGVLIQLTSNLTKLPGAHQEPSTIRWPEDWLKRV